MLNKDLIYHLAELSALDFSDIEKISEDMADIIALMDKVKEFTPETSEELHKGVDYNSLRHDSVLSSSSTETITSNSKNTENNCFVVPKIV